MTGSEMVIQNKPEHGMFRVLLSAGRNEGRDYSRVMRVEREDDGRFVYVCAGRSRLHILRTKSDFKFFKAGVNYKFKLLAKTVSFEESAEPGQYPNWRRVIPEGTRLIARTSITGIYRSFYLAGFYRAGIYINADYLKDIETSPEKRCLVYAGEDLGKAVVLKRAESREADFEAVIMPLRDDSLADVFIAEEGVKS